MQQMMRWVSSLFVRKRDLIHMVLELLSTGLFNVGIGIAGAAEALAVGGRIYQDATLGDRLSLYGNRFDLDTMYGFGVETGTLYRKAFTRHRWYVNANADGGASGVMELDANGLTINGYLNAQRLRRSGGIAGLAANTATSIDIPSFPCAFLFYPHSGATPAAIFYCRADNVAPVQIASSNPNTDYHTGALTGTTGTASRLNFSVHDGKLYVENRFGYGLDLDYLLVTR